MRIMSAWKVGVEVKATRRWIMRSAVAWLWGGGLETLGGTVFDIFGCGCDGERFGFCDRDGDRGYDGES
jgi:hypothetical protein